MKNLIIILVIFLSMLVSYQFIYAQWVQRYNGHGDGDDGANAIAVDGSGNVYVAGYTGESSAPGPHDYVTIKYNSSGIKQWLRIYKGPIAAGDDGANAIAVDGSGNVYVTGDIWGGSGTDDFYDWATIKYNSSGDSLWVRRYDGNGGINGDIPFSMAVDSSGNVYVTGYSVGSGTFDDYLTIKYNSNGDSVWVRRYSGPGNIEDRAYSIAIDNSGNVYVTGGSHGIGTDYDYTTIKYNSNGDSLWVRRYNGPGNGEDRAYSIAVDGSGNVYVTGQSIRSGFDRDFATIKYNSSGVQQWVQRYGLANAGNNDQPSLSVGSSGNIYVTGQSAGHYATIKYNSIGDSLWVQRYNGPADYDVPNSIAIDNLENIYVSGSSRVSGSDYDYATIKYNSSGVQQWVQRYDGPLNGGDFVSSMAVDNSGNVYVTGHSSNGTDIFTNDFATIKYSQQPTMALDLTALIEGFYNNVTNIMRRDTVRVYLRNASSPYSIVDSAKSVLDSTGYRRFNFPNAVNGTPYYIVTKHRNSIETWSNQGKMFTGYQLSYNFITTANKAYGNNLVLKGSKYCIYSGDINQDGIVDLSDFSQVDNDVYNSVSGYVATDVNGDNIVDMSDYSIVDNNAFNFVRLMRP